MDNALRKDLFMAIDACLLSGTGCRDNDQMESGEKDGTTNLPV
jgi:hypothetical protein